MRRAREKARQRKAERRSAEAVRAEEERVTVSRAEDPDLISRAEEEEGGEPPGPPSRRPVVHTNAIDSHTNDTFCTHQITPAHR